MAGKATRRKAFENDDPHRVTALLAATVLVATLPVLMGAVVLLSPKSPPAEHRFAAQAAAIGVSPVAIELGEANYRVACATCHGVEARGVPHLGKPLRNSAFVQNSTPESLRAVIERGRAAGEDGNTTGIPMPPRGGRTDLSDVDLSNIIAYVRSLQDPGQPTASLDDWTVQLASVSAVDGASSGGPEAALFVSSCSACHGADGAGVEGLGKSLRDSVWSKSKSDDELLAFLKQGRPIWDAENTTGIDMPPKGGNPALTDEELRSIIRHIRALQGETPATSAPKTSVLSGPGASLFVSSCSACHGVLGTGVEGLGKSLKDSAWVKGKNDDELFAFIKQGRPIWDAENTTGIDMPPKGGNPALSDDDLRLIIAHMRRLQGTSQE